MNKYPNLLKSDFTHPLSTLKQLNQILSDQQTTMNNRNVRKCLLSFFFLCQIMSREKVLIDRDFIEA